MPNTVHNVFDVLEVDGKNLTRRPYAERRSALSEIAENIRGGTIEFPFSWTGVDPSVILAASAEMGLEGIVCKHLDSPYTPGKRSRDWIKTPHRLRSEFVIGGWLPGLGPNRYSVAALLLGAHVSDGRLRFCGIVGTGFTDNRRQALAKQLRVLSRTTSPFETRVPDDIARHAHWATPKLVGDVEYREK